MLQILKCQYERPSGTKMTPLTACPCLELYSFDQITLVPGVDRTCVCLCHWLAHMLWLGKHVDKYVWTVRPEAILGDWNFKQFYIQINFVQINSETNQIADCVKSTEKRSKCRTTNTSWLVDRICGQWSTVAVWSPNSAFIHYLFISRVIIFTLC